MAVANPNQYSTDPIIGSSTPTTLVGIALGFVANRITAIHDGSTGNAYISLKSTVGTTDDFYLKPGESMTWDNVLTDRIGIASTTTSTVGRLRIGAWG